MGRSRTTKWLRSLFSASRKSPPEPPRRSIPNSADGHLDANKHAIAVAAATAAVAEAALAAAQAAAEVVRLTSARNDAPYVSADRRRAVAAVRIQSAFRAYLARRALRALKGLVKLQALVRGHIIRKQSADMLRRMQAMARIQARASSHRAEPLKFEYSHHPGAVNRRNYQHTNNCKQGGSILKMHQYTPRPRNSNSLKTESSHQPSSWLHYWMAEYAWNDRRIDDDRTDKILEIDTWKPRQPTRRSDRTIISTPQYSYPWNDMARHSVKLHKPNPSMSSEEVLSMVSPKGNQGAVYTAENSPRVQHSATSNPTIGPFTPTRSECSRSLFGDNPNYMSNTESSRAKVRSQSAPKQRMQMEELGMNHGLWELDANSEKGFVLPGNNYRYLPHPGHLRRQGTPGHGAYTGLGSTSGQRL